MGEKRRASEHYEKISKLLMEKKALSASELAVMLGVTRRYAAELLRAVCESMEKEGFLYTSGYCVKAT